jgi:hypothetical protein
LISGDPLWLFYVRKGYPFPLGVFQWTLPSPAFSPSGYAQQKEGTGGKEQNEGRRLGLGLDAGGHHQISVIGDLYLRIAVI